MPSSARSQCTLHQRQPLPNSCFALPRHDATDAPRGRPTLRPPRLEQASSIQDPTVVPAAIRSMQQSAIQTSAISPRIAAHPSIRSLRKSSAPLALDATPAPSLKMIPARTRRSSLHRTNHGRPGLQTRVQTATRIHPHCTPGKSAAHTGPNPRPRVSQSQTPLTQPSRESLPSFPAAKPASPTHPTSLHQKNAHRASQEILAPPELPTPQAISPHTISQLTSLIMIRDYQYRWQIFPRLTPASPLQS